MLSSTMDKHLVRMEAELGGTGLQWSASIHCNATFQDLFILHRLTGADLIFLIFRTFPTGRVYPF
jgi:hypothetical protein